MSSAETEEVDAGSRGLGWEKLCGRPKAADCTPNSAPRAGAFEATCAVTACALSHSRCASFGCILQNHGFFDNARCCLNVRPLTTRKRPHASHLTQNISSGTPCSSRQDPSAAAEADSAAEEGIASDGADAGGEGGGCELMACHTKNRRKRGIIRRSVTLSLEWVVRPAFL